MNKTMIQWITDDTNYRREDKPSRLEKKMLTKGINIEKNINYECPFGRSGPEN